MVIELIIITTNHTTKKKLFFFFLKTKTKTQKKIIHTLQYTHTHTEKNKNEKPPTTKQMTQVVETGYRFVEDKAIWVIHNMSKLPSSATYCVKSPVLQVCGHSWQLKFYPGGHKDAYIQNYNEAKTKCHRVRRKHNSSDTDITNAERNMGVAREVMDVVKATYSTGIVHEAQLKDYSSFYITLAAPTMHNNTTTTDVEDTKKPPPPPPPPIALLSSDISTKSARLNDVWANIDARIYRGCNGRGRRGKLICTYKTSVAENYSLGEYGWSRFIKREKLFEPVSFEDYDHNNNNNRHGKEQKDEKDEKDEDEIDESDDEEEEINNDDDKDDTYDTRSEDTTRDGDGDDMDNTERNNIESKTNIMAPRKSKTTKEKGGEEERNRKKKTEEQEEKEEEEEQEQVENKKKRMTKRSDRLCIEITVRKGYQNEKVQESSGCGPSTAHFTQTRISENGMLEDLTGLLWSGRDSDLKLIVHDKLVIPVHRFVLSLRSSVFRAMFNSKMAESHDSNVVFDEFEEHVALHFIFYCYTGTLDFDFKHIPYLLHDFKKKSLLLSSSSSSSSSSVSLDSSISHQVSFPSLSFPSLSSSSSLLASFSSSSESSSSSSVLSLSSSSSSSLSSLSSLLSSLASSSLASSSSSSSNSSSGDLKSGSGVSSLSLSLLSPYNNITSLPSPTRSTTSTTPTPTTTPTTTTATSTTTTPTPTTATTKVVETKNLLVVDKKEINVSSSSDMTFIQCVEGILMLADRYEVTDLFCLCINYLRHDLNVERALRGLILSDMYKHADWRRSCLAYLGAVPQRLSAAMKLPDFATLTPLQLVALMAATTPEGRKEIDESITATTRFEYESKFLKKSNSNSRALSSSSSLSTLRADEAEREETKTQLSSSSLSHSRKRDSTSLATPNSQKNKISTLMKLNKQKKRKYELKIVTKKTENITEKITKHTKPTTTTTTTTTSHKRTRRSSTQNNKPSMPQQQQQQQHHHDNLRETIPSNSQAIRCTVQQLRNSLRWKGLSTTGNKSMLVSRLMTSGK